MGIKQTLRNVGNANKNKAALDRANTRNRFQKGFILGGGVALIATACYNRKLRKEMDLIEQDPEKKAIDKLDKKVKKAQGDLKKLATKISKKTKDVVDTTAETIEDKVDDFVEKVDADFTEVNEVEENGN